jgi:hypothetical protein
MNFNFNLGFLNALRSCREKLNTHFGSKFITVAKSEQKLSTREGFSKNPKKREEAHF